MAEKIPNKVPNKLHEKGLDKVPEKVHNKGLSTVDEDDPYDDLSDLAPVSDDEGDTTTESDIHIVCKETAACASYAFPLGHGVFQLRKHIKGEPSEDLQRGERYVEIDFALSRRVFTDGEAAEPTWAFANPNPCTSRTGGGNKFTVRAKL